MPLSYLRRYMPAFRIWVLSRLAGFLGSVEHRGEVNINNKPYVITRGPRFNTRYIRYFQFPPTPQYLPINPSDSL